MAFEGGGGRGRGLRPAPNQTRTNRSVMYNQGRFPKGATPYPARVKNNEGRQARQEAITRRLNGGRK